ncbi:MAG: hypothetical protein K6G28_06115 [Acholeplasmatales bacterium]|nr:hypothetical protein [Acholeplasmatales bacterium]
MNRDHCPLCKEKKLYFIDPLESRNRMRELLKNGSMELLPKEMKQLVEQLNLAGDISEHEKMFYELHGRKCICMSCGFTFYEADDLSNYENMSLKEVSKEEYEQYLRDNCQDQEFIDFVLSKSNALEKYYLEALDQLLSEFKAVSDLNPLELKDNNNNQTNFVN